MNDEQEVRSWMIVFFVAEKQVSTLRGDNMSMLTHTHSHKPPRKINMTICNHQADRPLYVWPDIWSGDLQV